MAPVYPGNEQCLKEMEKRGKRKRGRTVVLVGYWVRFWRQLVPEVESNCTHHQMYLTAFGDFSSKTSSS
ncbi:hypothetical protein AAG906_015066 [Vitis piasezkii]